MGRAPASIGVLVGAVALLLGAACNRFNPKDYSPTAPPTEKALVLTASATTLPADGFSTVTVTARIDPAAAPDRRTIVFTTSAGKLVGATDNDGRKISLAADTSGQASVQLQSSQVVGTATVDASVTSGTQVLVDKRLDIQFTAVAPAALIRLSASPAAGTADGATPVAVSADISSGLPAGQRTVTFTTTLGTFADSQMRTTTAVADGGDRATVDLVSPTAGQARVTATVAQTSVQTTVAFSPALPDNLVVSPDKASLQASLTDSVNVTVTLLRSVGTVTAGTVVTYKVVRADTGADLGFLVRSVTPTNAAGQSQAVIVAGNTAFRGTATIVASGAGAAATGRANIEIVSPVG